MTQEPGSKNKNDWLNRQIRFEPKFNPTIWAVVNLPIAIFLGAVAEAFLKQLSDVAMGFVGIFLFWRNPSALDGWVEVQRPITLICGVLVAIIYYVRALQNKKFIKQQPKTP